MNILSTLLETGKTVFRTEELSQIVKMTTKRGFDSFLYRAKKDRMLLNPQKGIRTLTKYDPNELACYLRQDSYISLESVLYQAGVIFQYYGNTITCVSDNTRTHTIDGKQYTYAKIASKIRHNEIGIKKYKTYSIATPERALCDMVYLYPHTHIDNPQSIDQIRLKQILPLYPKKTAIYINKLLHAA